MIDMQSTAPARQRRPPVLIVDDEESLLDLCSLTFREEFELNTACSGDGAISLMESHGPFAVVVADMHMPGMSGSELLRQLQDRCPDTSRIMLTADNHQHVAVQAVNEGHVQQFLNKPVSMGDLASAIRAGVEHHGFRVAEKDLLASTLNGSVNLLVEMLSLVNPLAFGRATRIRRIADLVSRELAVTDAWEITIASLLSQLGCVTVPEAVLDKVDAGEPLSTQEQTLYQQRSQVAGSLVARIPRLSRIAEIITLQDQIGQHACLPPEAPRQGVHWRAALVRAAIDFDTLRQHGRQPLDALDDLREHIACYDPDVLSALATVVAVELVREATSVTLAQLQEGMLLSEHVVDDRGLVLITKGQELSDWHIERLRAHHSTGRSIRQPIQVSVKTSATRTSQRIEIPGDLLMSREPLLQAVPSAANHALGVVS